MKPTTHDTVQKLWALCHVLRDDGITYHQYVTELVFLLFLKMAKETGQEKELPSGWCWDDLRSREGAAQLQFYKNLLLRLGTEGGARVKAIYTDATTALRKPQSLKKLVNSIDAIDWFSTHREELGDLYEGLLEKNAAEIKSGAGQYFTPRALVDSMVALVKPKAGEVVQDPAAGTGGFLIAADRFVKATTHDLLDLDKRTQEFQQKSAFVGVELVPETRRLALMNLLLHDIQGDVHPQDTLSSFGAELELVHVMLSNPPFGTKQGGGKPTRADFTFPTSNKQLAFLQHIYRKLLPRGRAAVIVPDNVLFEAGVGVEIRNELMEMCDLHTILRLPTGIFYAHGVKTNVLFFARGTTDQENTRATWFYDLRTAMPSFGRRSQLMREHLAAFERAFGDDPYGKGQRIDEGEAGRWRCFTREMLKKRGDNLDVTWLKDEGAKGGDAEENPEVVAAHVVERLETALAKMKGLLVALGDKA